MSYSDDAVKARLAGLNDSQESIVTIAQWIMFHRRHADRTASQWLSRLQENQSTTKRLNLIHLANEVVQQSLARAKPDFMIAFEPLIADATALAYKGASQEIQGKLRRVVEVWRQRQIFDARIQEQTEQRLEEIDKQKGGKSLGGTSGRLGGSLFGGSAGGVAPELDHINQTQTGLTRAEAAAKAPVSAANGEYVKMTDPDVPPPSAPVRAAKLRGLVKELMAARSAVDASMKARRDLIAGLERLLESNRTKLAEEEATSSDLGFKIDGMEITIREVEDSIMRGQDTPSATETLNSNKWTPTEPERPETEGFTPPPPDIESFTPPLQQVGTGATLDERRLNVSSGAELIERQRPVIDEPPLSYLPPPAPSHQDPKIHAEDILKSLKSQGQVRQASSEIPISATGGNPGDPRLKRRKVGHTANNAMDDDFFGANHVGGVDEDAISAMLGQ